MLKLYYHPFASFCQKVLIALYEKDLAFEPILIDLGDPEQRQRLRAVWPMVKFPVLVDEARGVTLPETSVIIEYLDRVAPSPRMIPEDPDDALAARLWDRVFDGFIAPNVTKIVMDSVRAAGRSDPDGVDQARATIRTAYDLIEEHMAGRQWAAGDAFGLADCAAAPSLFYAGLCVPTSDHPSVAAYFQRLLARPSFARAVEEARPYRNLMPLPWTASY